jgi:hypothetical protein
VCVTEKTAANEEHEGAFGRFEKCDRFQ